MSGKIYVCGDLHGNLDKRRFNDFPDLNEDDILIVCGDFGYLEREEKKREERKKLKELTKTVNGATILFIDGNHENFKEIENLEFKCLFGNEVGVVTDKIFHLKRGRVYNINDKNIFTFGGATSIDRMRRIPDINWWHREVPSEIEIEIGLNVSKSEKIDYVITHTCPFSVRRKIKSKNMFNLYCYAESALEKIKKNLNGDFDKWYFGHFHIDEGIDGKYRALYKDIVKLGE